LQERLQNKGENKKIIIFEIQLYLIESKILFYFSPLLHEYSDLVHGGGPHGARWWNAVALVRRIRGLRAKIQKDLVEFYKFSRY
jgi:hypothetical protein